VKTPVKTPVKTQREILTLLQQDRRLTIARLARRLAMSESAIERAIRKLREMGLLVRVGPDKGGYWRVLK